MAAIVVEGLRKAYRDVQAVRDVSFEVGEGQVLALLGPNGAGKTTTVEILEGYRSRDAGRVSVLGVDPERGGRALRERVGIVPQEAGLYPELRVLEALRLHALYYPRPHAVDEVITMTGLEEKRDALIKTLSGGQKRRLDLALGIVGNPDLLFLEEPTTGFDPSARRQAWDVVGGLRGLGKTILLTTHYMDEAQHLADHRRRRGTGRGQRHAGGSRGPGP
jgi:ABC-2 type transport system ATP-binding protein